MLCAGLELSIGNDYIIDGIILYFSFIKYRLVSNFSLSISNPGYVSFIHSRRRSNVFGVQDFEFDQI